MKTITNAPAGKPPTSHTSRFYLERKHCVSGYPFGMLYGAAVLAPKKYGQPRPRVYIRLNRRLVPIWAPLVSLSRPFNRYLPGHWATQRGTK